MSRVFLAALIAVFLVSGAQAAPGDLDTTFGGGKGWVSTAFQQVPQDSYAHDMIQQADGKLVAVGQIDNAQVNFALVRYNLDGTLDTTFNVTGMVATAFGSTNAAANSVIQQTDGKLVAAGSSNGDFALARYNEDGSLDATFNGTGKLTTNILGSDIAYSVIQQADGKLVVAGSSYSGSNFDFVLARFNSDGSLDSTFNGSGKVSTAVGSSNDEAYSLIQQADGKLVVAGYSNNGSNDNFALVRYNSNGSLDTTFDADGKLTTPVGSYDCAYSVIQQTDGKLVAAGYSNNGINKDFALVRYNINGSLDTGFGTAGKIVTAIGSGGDEAHSVIQQTDGRLVVSGYSHNGSDYDFALVRYNTNGSLDTAFNGAGKLTTAVGTSTDFANSVIQQADGKLVAVGGSKNARNHNDFALVRYNSNGSLDASFNSTGKVTTVVYSTIAFAYSVIQQADGKLVLAGRSQIGTNGNDFALVRYNVNGSLDAGFGTGGKVTVAIGSGGDEIHSVIQQADGKLVAAGRSWNGQDNFALARFNLDGTLDTTFNATGIVITTFGSTHAAANSVIQQTDGKLVAAGYSCIGSSSCEFALVRYNADGSLDTTFDADGKLTTPVGSYDRAYSVIEQADGKLVAAGYGFNAMVMVRYNVDGTLDSGFATGGKVTTAIGCGDYVCSLIQQTDGKLVLAGSSGSNFALARYNSDGVLDTSFNNDGAVATGGANSVTQQADGKLVAAGYSLNGSKREIALVRYNTNGSLDTSFNSTGKVITAIGSSHDDALSVIQQADGRLATAIFSRQDNGWEFVVARYESGQPDTDGDGEIDGFDNDDDGDGIADVSDACPLDATAFAGNNDGDTLCDLKDPDDDNDGVVDTSDDYPLDPAESVDTDSDGIGNNADLDDDNDGVADTSDALPLDATESVDTDGDGIGDNTDPDIDNDTVLNAVDNCSLSSNTNQLNTDGDTQGNTCDVDDDNDSVLDGFDACPLDATASTGNYDGDVLCDLNDLDDDNDGVADTSDAFPLDATESDDADGDGIGNNADLDDDNDGVKDISDAFPLDASESSDTDDDGIGDNTDPDIDNDTFLNAVDNCPLISNASQLNTDGDAQGNDCDVDDDNDGVVDDFDACPLDSAESADNTDGDTLCDLNDLDDDNDGFLDARDALPFDSTEWADADSDGTGDNAEYDDDNDGVDDDLDNCPVAANADQINTDGDAQGDACDATPDDKETAVKITAGDQHACTITNTGGVQCWGNNDYGQLGNNSYSYAYKPVAVRGLSSGITAITTGNYHTCALNSSGGVVCWGNNDYGQLGSYGYANVPKAVSGLSAGVVAISAGAYHTCALTNGGAVLCWGEYSSTPVAVSGLGGEVSAIAAGGYHDCALMSSGGAMCWGYNGYGQLGDNSTVDQPTPVAVSGLGSGVVAIEAGANHSCAVIGGGEMKCWGYNGDGELGDSSNVDQLVPVAVTGLSIVQAAATGLAHSCALTSAGAIDCWGANYYGQLGDNSINSSNSPVAVSGLDKAVVAIAAGGYHSCAVTNEGGILCWGANWSGQLGDNSGSDQYVPVWVSGFEGVDSDGDGVVLDNCSSTANSDQLNTDGDASGDACDGDDDNDGVLDVSDPFPLNPAEWLDTDSDGAGNNADMDDDNDGIPDYIDADPLNAAIHTEKILPLNGQYKGSALKETAIKQ